jgi:hypothetical protein
MRTTTVSGPVVREALVTEAVLLERVLSPRLPLLLTERLPAEAASRPACEAVLAEVSLAVAAMLAPGSSSARDRHDPDHGGKRDSPYGRGRERHRLLFGSGEGSIVPVHGPVKARRGAPPIPIDAKRLAARLAEGPAEPLPTL